VHRLHVAVVNSPDPVVGEDAHLFAAAEHAAVDLFRSARSLTELQHQLPVAAAVVWVPGLVVLLERVGA
jgi:hypothetical protein